MRPEHSLAIVEANSDFLRLGVDDGLFVDLRYASERNFVGENVYGAFNRAYLHRLAVKKLITASARLRAEFPELRLVILDALRPRSAQWILWNSVVGTRGEQYVSEPHLGSVHCYGFAVDLTLADANGCELDMGTEFDYFAELSEPRLEDFFLSAGKLSPAVVANRRILRSVMVAAGFLPLANEWWHFDALQADEVRSRFPIVE